MYCALVSFLHKSLEGGHDVWGGGSHLVTMGQQRRAAKSKSRRWQGRRWKEPEPARLSLGGCTHPGLLTSKLFVKYRTNILYYTPGQYCSTFFSVMMFIGHDHKGTGRTLLAPEVNNPGGSGCPRAPPSSLKAEGTHISLPPCGSPVGLTHRLEVPV